MGSSVWKRSDGGASQLPVINTQQKFKHICESMIRLQNSRMIPDVTFQVRSDVGSWISRDTTSLRILLIR